jgi:tRNA-splicing ligase RtcB (3'-phosphate/5'-hydroxy nucleic acid ligase)
MAIYKQAFTRISEYVWELGTKHNPNMRVPVRVYADDALLEEALRDASLEQAVNVACLPGLVGYVVVMPDVHQGYGMPIGGVMATQLPDGVISPGSIGYDINCGVRLLGSRIPLDAVKPYLPDLATVLYRNCPSGVGGKGAVRLSGAELDKICREGARWALREGYARKEDLDHTEEYGEMDGAEPGEVSARAKERGRGQLGTLGAGNHFIEVDVVDQIFDAGAAATLGLRAGHMAVQIHCGSRGFGHQICTDYVQAFQGAAKRYGIHLADRELVCAPFNSPEGRSYYGAMKAAANFAFCNRQLLAHLARESFTEVLKGKVPDWDLHQVYDITHNMGKVETHEIGGEARKVCVHRKGATRAFGPGFAGLPPDYRPLGQPVLVPGSMGTASWVLLGTATSMLESFGSSCHGAGRVMSRSRAKHEVRGETLRQELEAEGIRVRAGSLPGLAEEAPTAYKDVDRVIAVVTRAGIARKVARLRPVAVVKG